MKEEKKHHILVINPGSTSTKIAMFENETQLWDKTIAHSTMELEQFDHVWAQYDFRKRTILRDLEERGTKLEELSAVVGRGGFLSPLESGTYRVDNKMIDDLRAAKRGEHASNLGPILAYGIAWDLGIEAFTVDPVSVDELEPIARYSGVPEIPRESVFHALNIKAVARKYALSAGKKLDEINLIVTHMGGGITSCALRKGRMIDVNHGLGEGPFTPERAGSVPTLGLVELCFSGRYTKKEIKEKLLGGGGLAAYLGTNSAIKVESMINAGDRHAREIYEAMAYQVAKEIGTRAAVLKGEVDQIVLTGGLAHSRMFIDMVEERVRFIAPVTNIPGGFEMEALALGALRVLTGEEPARRYGEEKKTVGVIFWESLTEYVIAMEEFEKVLKCSGYRFREANETIELTYRNCDGHYATCREIAEDFLNLKVDLIYSIGSPVVTTVKKLLTNTSIPVVCAEVLDPVIMGLQKDYEGIGDNITGTYYKVSFADQLDKGLIALIGKINRLGIIHTVGELHSEIQLDEAKKLAKCRGIKLMPFDVQSEEELHKAREYFQEHKIDALFLPADIITAQASRKTIMTLAREFPTFSALKTAVHKGALVSYCANWRKLCETSAKIAARILSGVDPRGIPFVGPEEHQLVINMATARHFGITISEDIRCRAAELIN